MSRRRALVLMASAAAGAALGIRPRRAAANHCGTDRVCDVRNGTKALTRQAALLEIKEAAVAAGLSSPERVSPHVLRHAFATHMHSGGTDLRVLQELLGHAGIETTQIYTHLDTSRLHQMVRDLHPLNGESTSAA